MNGGSRILWAAALLLVLHASLVAWGIARNSVTIDEANHLPAGMSYVRFGTYELYHQNPPLVKLLATGPALLAGASEDYGRFWRHARMTGGPINYVGMGQDFMRANESPPGHYHRIYRAARVVGLLFSILGGVALFTWARELFGDRAGLVSLALWCFSPNIIANAAILATDLPAAVMILVSTYAFWRWLHGPRPGWLGACLVGVLLGLAQLTKFSALALFGLWPLLAIPVLAGWGETGQRKAPGPLLARGAAIVALSLLTINLGYGFEGSGRHLGEFDFLSTTLTVPRLRPADPQPLHFHRAVYSARVNRFRGTVLEDLPVPLPEHYVLGLDEQSFETNPQFPGYGFPVYLRGELRVGGWWYYYVYALLVKSTPGAQLLALATLAALLFAARTRLGPRTEIFVWLPPIAMLGAMTFLTDINLGLRYALVCFPFFMLAAGRLGPLWSDRRWRALIVLGIALHAGSTLWIAPHYAAYFSPMVGGPARGHEHLIDSNLDWGQDLLALRDWLDERGVEAIRAALFTNIDPGLAGLRTSLIPRDPTAVAEHPTAEPDADEPVVLLPGLYAVSVNYVMGLPFRIILRDRAIPVPQNAYSYFQALEPIDRVGYSIWIYELSREDSEALNHQLGLPRRS